MALEGMVLSTRGVDCSSSTAETLPFTDPRPSFYPPQLDPIQSDFGHHSRRKSRTTLRNYLYGATSTMDARSRSYISSSEDESPATTNRRMNMARRTRNRLSRTGSAFTQLSIGKSASLELSADNSEDEAVMAEIIREKAILDSQRAANRQASPDHKEALMNLVPIPVRRKSLYTPGLATRSTSDILRKPPSPQNCSNISAELRNQYYNPDHPADSPLTMLASLDIGDQGRATPLNLHVPHLGGLELGSLRVTNGAASPSPSKFLEVDDQSTIYNTSIASDPAYVTASEGSEGGDRRTTALDSISSLHASQDFDQESYRTIDARIEKAIDDQISVYSSLSPSGGNLTDTCMSSAASYIAALGPRTGVYTPVTPNINHDLFPPQIKDELCAIQIMSDMTQQGTRRQSANSSDSRESDHLSKIDSGYQSAESLDHTDGSFVQTKPQAPIHTQPVYQYLPTLELIGKQIALNKPTLTHSSGPKESETKHKAGCEAPRGKRVRERTITKRRRQSYTSPPTTVLGTMHINQHDFDTLDIPRIPSIMVRKNARRIAKYPVAASDWEQCKVNHLPQKSPLIEPFTLSVKSGLPESLAAKSSNLGMRSTSETAIPKPVLGLRARSGEGQVFAEVVEKSFHWPSSLETECRKREAQASGLDNILQALSDDEDNLQSTFTRKKRLSWSRSKNTEVRKAHQEPKVTMADFGAVAQSIGASPYDIVTSMNPPRMQRSETFHPFQLGSVSQQIYSGAKCTNAEINSHFVYTRHQGMENRSYRRSRLFLPEVNEEISHRSDMTSINQSILSYHSYASGEAQELTEPLEHEYKARVNSSTYTTHDPFSNTTALASTSSTSTMSLRNTIPITSPKHLIPRKRVGSGPSPRCSQ